MKKRRTLTILLLTLLLVVGIPTGFVLSEYHHIQVSRTLIAAVKADDTHLALTALNAGADADYPQNENAPRPLWLQWLNRIAGLKFPEKAIGASLLAHGADWRPNEHVTGELLEEHGVVASPRDEPGGMGFAKGDTALRLAQRKGNREIVQMLKNAGAKE